jgi:hypothetical protein
MVVSNTEKMDQCATIREPGLEKKEKDKQRERERERDQKKNVSF